MTAKKPFSIATILLSIILIVSLLNVQVAFADGEPPTEPPAPTQVETEPPQPSEPPNELPLPTQPPVESTSDSVEAMPIPEETTVAPLEEVLIQVPESTEVVVLDESGDSLPLATQEAAEIIQAFDPMWCPAGVLPGGTACSQNFPSIGELVNNISTDPLIYDDHGIIYFKETTGTETTGESFALTRAILGTSDFNTLNVFNLTLQGGWNGLNGAAATFTGQTNFGSNTIAIGGSGTGTRWVGDVTLNSLLFNAGDQSSVIVYTTSGSITLDNIDVLDHGGDTNTAILNSTSGNIIVQNGSIFDGNGTSSKGFSATTAGNGSITVSDTSFSEITGDSNYAYDGARLSASTVTLNNVSATGNEANGIRIENANLVTLNSVLANYNGTLNNFSGVYVNGKPESRLIIAGGTFNDNKGYGVQIGNTANTTVYIQSTPVCERNGRNPLGCFNSGVTVIPDISAPVISPTISGAAGPNGWYGGDVSVSWSVRDDQSGILSENGCSVTTLNSETTGITLTCSATNKAGLSSSESVTIKIDKTAPTLSLPAPITVEATEPTGAVVNYSASANDLVDGAVPVSCSPLSGATFPLGTTTVSCSSTDQTSHISNSTFPVTVDDTTAPSIASLADIVFDTYRKTGKNVTFASPSTFDIVDGAGIASCAPAPGSFFEIGTTEVICTSTDSHGNTATRTFFIDVDRVRKISALQSSDLPLLSVPLTGAEKIDLDCQSDFWAFGVKFSFVKLCDYQTTINSIDLDKLPGKLPDGFTPAMGLNMSLFKGNQTAQELPDGASVQLDFPTTGGAKSQFAVLYWNGGEWTELSLQNANNQNSQILSIVTDKVGTFVLVKK